MRKRFARRDKRPVDDLSIGATLCSGWEKNAKGYIRACSDACGRTRKEQFDDGSYAPLNDVEDWGNKDCSLMAEAGHTFEPFTPVSPRDPMPDDSVRGNQFCSEWVAQKPTAQFRTIWARLCNDGCRNRREVVRTPAKGGAARRVVSEDKGYLQPCPSTGQGFATHITPADIAANQAAHPSSAVATMDSILQSMTQNTATLNSLWNNTSNITSNVASGGYVASGNQPRPADTFTPISVGPNDPIPATPLPYGGSSSADHSSGSPANYGFKGVGDAPAGLFDIAVGGIIGYLVAGKRGALVGAVAGAVISKSGGASLGDYKVRHSAHWGDTISVPHFQPCPSGWKRPRYGTGVCVRVPCAGQWQLKDGSCSDCPDGYDMKPDGKCWISGQPWGAGHEAAPFTGSSIWYSGHG